MPRRFTRTPDAARSIAIKRDALARSLARKKALASQISLLELRLGYLRKRLDLYTRAAEDHQKAITAFEQGGDTGDIVLLPTGRVTPLPNGALAGGALKVMREAGVEMTARTIAEAVVKRHGFTAPAAMLDHCEEVVRQNLRGYESEGLVIRSGPNAGALWRIRPISELRSFIEGKRKLGDPDQEL